MTAALSVALVPVARADPPASERSQPVYGIGRPEPYRVETEHGSIYGEVVRPVDPETGEPLNGVPVVLTISPYNASRQPSIAASPAPVLDGDPSEFWVTRGYARAFFDVLGTHLSTGCYDFGGTREQEAAAAVVDHLGELPWTNGKVGMIGISYDGQTQLEAAVQQPEHLAAIIPQAAPSTAYESSYWAGVQRSLQPVPATHAAIYGFALGGPEPCDKVEHTMRVNEHDPVYDGFWAERDYRAVADRIEVPVLLEAGWLDGTGYGTNTVHPLNATRLFAALQPEVPKRLRIGQWGHGAAQFDDSRDLRQAWFDEFLLGLDTGVRATPVVDSQPAHGERRPAHTWPPPGTHAVDIELVTRTPATGEAGIVEGEPSFTDLQPRWTGFEALLPDPVGTWVLYQTPPVTSEVRISGAPVLDLRLTSTNPSTHVCVLVFDVAPDGGFEVISSGMLNSRNRNGIDVSEPVVPKTAYAAPVDIWDTDRVVAAGHSLSMFINASSCGSDDQRGSTNTILDGSFLRLPVSEGADAFRR